MNNQTRPDWDTFHMESAYHWAQRSPDPSTQVGAVIVDAANRQVSTGYNGWPKGIAPFAPDDPRWSRTDGLKYKWIEHAERNAIYNAANHGLRIAGCRLYVPWLPCCDCARAIVTCGINEVIVHAQAVALIEQRWDESNQIAMDMFHEAGVAVRSWDGRLPVPRVRMFGTTYDLSSGLLVAVPVQAND